MKKIYVVGLGPGGFEQMSKRAMDAINKSDVIMGYTYYIDLIKDKIKDKEVFVSPMTKEVFRCGKALEYALSGKTVSMVSSGDSGVYGMASVIYEVCGNYPEVEIEVIPGITACLSGASVLGAPISHDFAVISLSDLLTPWDKIEKRLDLAAEGDFVICIYNPSSKKRADYLKKACQIVLKHKNADTVCGYVKNIGRNGQEYHIVTLNELQRVKTDMFTTVIIGNSQTKVINGKMVTPRGYVYI
ncbi:MAG: precorrin-3B C(17)-methyltransferase [Clostridiales bacterium]|jgi:precorrin-3B C17-methyltransferase|nr:precorrin-3B C(17)-methyltransferase [Clostridiales bacterium]